MNTQMSYLGRLTIQDWWQAPAI